MAFRVRLNLDKSSLNSQAREVSARLMRERAPKVGAIAVQQAKQRFTDSGDDEIKWPDLWANKAPLNDEEARRELDSRVDKATKSLKRANDKLARARASGDLDAMDKARKSIARAQASLDRASEAQEGGNPSFRRGGQPLRDTGQLAASMTFDAQQTDRGSSVRIGSPLPHARFHQDGFSKDGVSFIPLSVRAKRKPPGTKPEDFGLERGKDFTFLTDVTVPARPIVRFSKRNREDIRETLGRGA